MFLKSGIPFHSGGEGLSEYQHVIQLPASLPYVLGATSLTTLPLLVFFQLVKQ